MKVASVATLLAVLIMMVGVLAFQAQQPVQAQGKGFEYGYIVKVSRAESYDLEVERWAAQPKKSNILRRTCSSMSPARISTLSG